MSSCRIVFPSEIFPSVAQAVCDRCGWEGPCRDITRDGPARLLEGDARLHRHNCRPITIENVEAA